MRLPLIGYDRSPAVLCLEHSEQRDLIQNPDRASYYALLIEARRQKRRKARVKEGPAHLSTRTQ